MTGEIPGHRLSGFTVRFVVAVGLAAGLTALGEAVLAGRLVTEGLTSQAVEQVHRDVAALQKRAALSEDPAAAARSSLRHLRAREDVRSARLDVPSETDVPSEADVPSETDVLSEADGGAASRTTSPTASSPDPGHDITVVVPVDLGDTGGTVQVVLDGRPVSRQATAIRRGVLVVLALGALAAAPLALLFGGTALARRDRRTTHAARVDDLTGLGSRWAFEDDLARRTEAARRHRTPLVLGLLDVSGVESVRETDGRRRAETLLAHATQILRPRGAEHLAYRVTGDGFAVIMPATTPEQARDTTARWARWIAAQAGPLRADVGVCALDEEICPDAQTLVIGAESCLEDARERRAAAAPPPGVGDDQDGWDLSWLR